MHVCILQWCRCKCGRQELAGDYWGFVSFISMETPELCGEVETDINVESKEHKS